jgi:putative PIN family toxin of toxin-antitoxin system
MKAVLDTNVLVSALWNPQGPPAKVLMLLANGGLQPVYSPIILAEYREVLARKRFKFDQKDVSQMLDFIQLVGKNVAGQASGRNLPDATDLPFLDAAIEGEATHIVTGNMKDFPADACNPIKPVSPADFLAHKNQK